MEMLAGLCGAAPGAVIIKAPGRRSGLDSGSGNFQLYGNVSCTVESMSYRNNLLDGTLVLD